MNFIKELIDKLVKNKNLTDSEFKHILKNNTKECREYAFLMAQKVSQSVFGNKIYIRGLIEISNYCKKDCYYCGIRKSNNNAKRYRLSKSDILHCCSIGYELGFRTFVMQSGEDDFFNDDYMVQIIKEIRSCYKDCAITLSIGEKNYETYKKFYNAGANRFLLRNETADCEHYSKMHPKNTTLQNRMECLHNLKRIGFQTGCGIMVGSPYQSVDCLVKDLRFIKNFNPEMVGIGPFLTHNDTPFKNFKSGSFEMTLLILALVRIMLPYALIPATTALATIDKNGRQSGILAGANVVMPNLSPKNVRSKYMLYNNKASTGLETAESLFELKNSFLKIGYNIVCDRGDYAFSTN